MIANSRIQELIREDKAEYIPEAVGEGSFFDMQTLTTALIELVVAVLVEQEVAANAAPNRHDFMIALDRALKEQRSSASRPQGGGSAAEQRDPSVSATGAGAA